MYAPTQELETYRVFSAEQDFKYASETFLQVRPDPRERHCYCLHDTSGFPRDTKSPVAIRFHQCGLQAQARRWLAKVFQQSLPDFPLSVLLENGYVL